MKTEVGEFRSRSQPLTNIAPIRPGMSWAAWAFLMLMRRISKLTMARDLQFIHFARWQRVRSKKLPHLSGIQPKESFKNDFFLFATNYNGPWDQYIDTFARIPRIRRGMWWLWRFSQGYPGPFPIRTFKEWIHYHTYPEILYYDAYPRSTVRNIDASLMIKSAVDQFVADTPPAESPKAFRVRYLALIQTIAPHLGSAPGLPVAAVSGPMATDVRAANGTPAGVNGHPLAEPLAEPVATPAPATSETSGPAVAPDGLTIDV